MATLTELATQALRKLFVVADGESPEVSDLSVALGHLRHVLARLPEYGGGRAMVERTTSESETVDADTRTISTVSGIVLTFPSTPRAGTRVGIAPLTGTATVKSLDRKIEGAAASVLVSLPSVWIYREDLIDWVLVTALSDTNDSPWPSDCDSALVDLTAMESAPAFQVSIGPELGAAIENSKAFLRAKYNRPGVIKAVDLYPRTVARVGRRHL